MLEHKDLDGVTLVSPRNELDASSAQRAKEAFEELIAQGTTRLVVDLSNLEYIDSAGLGVLVSALKMLRARGGDLRLCCVREPVQMILDLTRLNRVFKIYGERNEAVSSFGAGDGAGGVRSP